MHDISGVSPASPRKRRLGALVIVLGLVVAAAPLASEAPEERAFVLRIAAPDAVERVDLLWLDASGEALRQTTLSYRRGAAPTRIERQVSLTDGRYSLVATLWRDGMPQATERIIDVGDDATEIVLPVP